MTRSWPRRRTGSLKADGRAVCRAIEGVGCETSLGERQRQPCRETEFCGLCALHVEIPAASLELASFCYDLRGTLSERDELLGGIAKRPGALRGTLEPRLLPADTVHKLRLQLVLGDDRAEVSLDDLERLENWPLC